MPARLLTSSDLPSFAEDVGSADRIAVDTEFHAERRYIPKLYLVQVYVPGGDAWILDPLEGDSLARAAEVLQGVPWIVHGGSQDIRLLGRTLGGVPDVVLDTQIGAGLLTERFPEGYASLVQRFLGRTLPKSSTLSDWSRRPLTEEQLRYATDDVLRLPDLWNAIEHRLVERDRLDIAHDACASARARHLVEPDPQEVWRRFAAAPGMTWRARAILREVTAWREALAQERNQPPRTILGDGTVIELAKRPPTTRDGILANRRFPRSAQKHVDVIWDAVRRGQAVPSSEAPMCPDRYSTPWRCLHVLQAWASMLAHERQLSRRLVLDDELLARLALAPPTTRPEVAEQLGLWRDALVGDDAWAWFSGSQGVHMQEGMATLTS